MNRPRPRRIPALAMLSVAGLMLACTDDGGSLIGPRRSLDAARGGGSTTSVAVTATSPSYGKPGTVHESVTISGTGFQPGAQAAWLQLNDSLDTTIAVVSTQFVNSTTVTSVIDISPNANVAFRNVKVTNADRTKGIGNEVFEVTLAIPTPGVSLFRAAGDSALAGGGPGGTVWWSVAQGAVAVGPDSSQGQAISPMGNVIGSNKRPRIYTRLGPVGSPWQLTMLPVDLGVVDGGAWALLTDPTTGQLLVVGGREKLPISKKVVAEEPLVWTRQSGSGTWQVSRLPTGGVGTGSVKAMSGDTTVVGWLGPTGDCCYPGAGNTAAIWRVDAVGVWHVTAIGPVGSGAEGITPAGTEIVGLSGGMAAYWLRNADGSWGSPIPLPGNCSEARGVDAAGEILLTGCVSGASETAAVMAPPYSTSTMRFLGGLGPKSPAFVSGISPSGQYVAGQGVYWKMF